MTTEHADLATTQPLPTLCERCGYNLSGISDSTNCPECGTPVARSLPTARPGTAFQQRPSLGGWLRASARTLLRPNSTFRTLAIDRTTLQWYLIVNIFLASSLVTFAALVSQGVGTALIVAPLGGIVLGFIPLVMTEVERLGTRLISKRRGWRLTSDVSYCVCAQATIGWVLAGVLATVASVLGVWFDQINRPNVYMNPSTLLAVRLWSFVGAVFVGFMTFELLVFLGSRACRYANPPSANPPSANPPSARPPAGPTPTIASA